MKWISSFGDFDGRISRKTFWLTGIAIFIVQIVIAVIAGGTFGPNRYGPDPLAKA